MTNRWNKLFKLDKYRQEEISNQAARVQLQFTAEDPYFIKNQLSEFKLFKQGTSKSCYNIISKKELDYNLYLFDYKFTISTGKSAYTYKQTVLFIDSKLLSLPAFFQEPEHFFHRLMAYLGFDDIDFESHQEYSKKHKLTGEYEQVVRHYFSKGVLDLLSQNPAFCMEGMNYYFILYKNHEYLPTHQIGAFLELGQMLYELFLLKSDKS